MSPHLTHLFMEVGDMAAAKRFWVDLCGLELLTDRGAYMAVGGNGGFYLGIEQTAEPVTGGPEITLRVSDVDAATEELRKAGVSILEEPRDMPWGARHTWIADPDGRRTSIYTAI